MPRVKVGVTAHRRHKKILKLAKGYKGSKSKQFKKANETVMKALYYARRDRRAKKGNFRRTLDRSHQCCCPSERHFLQPSRQRPHEGWR